LHACPELGFEERKTASLIAGVLDSLNVSYTSGIAKTGVVASIKCGNSDRAIGLRADIDCLEIQEANSFPHASPIPNRMHACGHDGHTAMLLAAVNYLSASRNFNGTVHFIFQPAEEGLGGAQAMIDDGLFERFPMQEVYALHNYPELALGEVATKSGPIMAGADDFRCRVTGKGGHAGMPHLCQDSITVAAQVASAWQLIVARECAPTEPAVISISTINAGTGFNVLPESVEISGTIRAMSGESIEFLRKRMQAVATGICTAFACTADIRFEEKFLPTINSPIQTGKAIQAARNVVGAGNVRTDLPPAMGSEDFANMLAVLPGAYVWLGTGQAASEPAATLHNATYDFNDDVLPIGASYWASLVESSLPA
jgi:hippurate hydrolase